MSLPTPTHDTIKARIARATRPGYGWCGRCGMPWGLVRNHLTRYSSSRSVRFSLVAARGDASRARTLADTERSLGDEIDVRLSAERDAALALVDRQATALDAVRELADGWVRQGVLRSLSGTVSAERGHELRAAIAAADDDRPSS